MIILSGTSDTVRVSLASGITTNNIHCYVAYRDIIPPSGFTAGRYVTNISGLTSTIIVPAPSANTITRVVDFISLENRDTQLNTPTIFFQNSSDEYPLYKTPLSPNDKIQYNDRFGFKTNLRNGDVKIDSGIYDNFNYYNYVKLNSNINYLSGTTANLTRTVTGMSFSVISGNTYYFKAFIGFDVNATTVGSRWFLTGGTFSLLAFKSLYSLTTTTQTLNHGVIAYNSPAASNTTSAVIFGNIAELEGIIRPTQDSTLQLLTAIETGAGTMTVLKGSIIFWKQII